METFLNWEEATGEWVHVEIKTTFGKSMTVRVLMPKLFEKGNIQLPIVSKGSKLHNNGS